MGQSQPSTTVVADPLFEFGPPAGLAHSPFFAALASLEGQKDSSEWRAIAAGLLVLRLVDRYLDSLSQSSTTLPADLLATARLTVDALDAR